MSACGTKRTSPCAQPMSAFGGKADIAQNLTVGPRARLSAAFCLHPVQSRESNLTQMSKWRSRVNRLAGRLGVSGGDGLDIRFFGGFGMKNSSGGVGLAREERLQIMLSLAELNAVDNYRFQ